MSNNNNFPPKTYIQMQSLLTDSFGNSKQQKAIVKTKNATIEADQQQDDSKRDEQYDDNDSQLQSEKPQKKLQEPSEELQAMKDAFQSDDSYLQVTEGINQERALNEAINNGLNGNKNAGITGPQSDSNGGMKAKKIIKKKKDFLWKIMWVKQQNAVKNSKPLWVKKWLRVKSHIDTTQNEPANDKSQQNPDNIESNSVKV